MSQQLYTSGEYLDKNPTWHIEESPWKAQQILRMLTLHHLAPRTICEVGCGAGEVLKQLQGQMDEHCLFWGYDISPQALKLAQSRVNTRLHFKLANIGEEEDTFFDLIAVMDVLEHLPDYYGFLATLKPRSRHKIFHVPLDLSVQTVLRPHGLLNVHEWYGHLHYFTKETALEMFKEAGYNVLDYFYTARALETPTHNFGRKLLRVPRKVLSVINQDFAARLLGGWSLLILAE
jgi:hypothetical protein